MGVQMLCHYPNLIFFFVHSIFSHSSLYPPHFSSHSLNLIYSFCPSRGGKTIHGGKEGKMKEQNGRRGNERRIPCKLQRKETGQTNVLSPVMLNFFLPSFCPLFSSSLSVLDLFPSSSVSDCSPDSFQSAATFSWPDGANTWCPPQKEEIGRVLCCFVASIHVETNCHLLSNHLETLQSNLLSNIEDIISICS